jgi:trehalose 6-phosphate synthase/phosphatase
VQDPNQRLIIVSNRAPVKVSEKGGELKAVRADGGLSTALAEVWSRPDCLWVGWSGLGRSFSQAEYEKLQLGHKLAMINLESELYHAYYYNFSNGSMWPVLHGFEPRTLYTEDDMEAVKAVSERFASCIERVSSDRDAIWVHDFHLVLVPQALRQRGLRNRIGFFLHIPFPTPEKFRTLPHHRRIATSLAQSDVIGFQTEGDAQRFRQYLDEEDIALGRVKIAAYPIGIDYYQYAEARQTPEAQRYRKEIDREYGDRTVMLSVSRLDYTKGIMHQLRALDKMLSLTKRRDLVYKLIVSPSREDLVEYQEVKEQSAALADDINRRHGHGDWRPVEFTYRTFDMDELSAWYARADVMVVTPLIDGMNLVAKEYVAGHDDDGVLVLGKGAGASEQLSEAVITDPLDAAGMAKALKQALDMEHDERRRRMRALRLNVQTEDVHWWAESFLSDLS